MDWQLQMWDNNSVSLRMRCDGMTELRHVSGAERVGGVTVMTGCMHDCSIERVPMEGEQPGVYCSAEASQDGADLLAQAVERIQAHLQGGLTPWNPARISMHKAGKSPTVIHYSGDSGYTDDNDIIGEYSFEGDGTVSAMVPGHVMSTEPRSDHSVEIQKEHTLNEDLQVQLPFTQAHRICYVHTEGSCTEGHRELDKCNEGQISIVGHGYLSEGNDGKKAPVGHGRLRECTAGYRYIEGNHKHLTECIKDHSFVADVKHGGDGGTLIKGYPRSLEDIDMIHEYLISNYIVTNSNIIRDIIVYRPAGLSQCDRHLTSTNVSTDTADLIGYRTLSQPHTTQCVTFLKLWIAIAIHSFKKLRVYVKHSDSLESSVAQHREKTRCIVSVYSEWLSQTGVLSTTNTSIPYETQCVSPRDETLEAELVQAQYSIPLLQNEHNRQARKQHMEMEHVPAPHRTPDTKIEHVPTQEKAQQPHVEQNRQSRTGSVDAQNRKPRSEIEHIPEQHGTSQSKLPLQDTEGVVSESRLKPLRTSRPSLMTRPSVMTRPSGSSRPSVMTRPSMSSPPSVMTRPSMSSPPSVMTRPSGSSRPSVMTRPSVSSPPSVMIRPSGSSPPSVMTRPSMSSTPSVMTRPSVSSPPPLITLFIQFFLLLSVPQLSTALCPSQCRCPNSTSQVVCEGAGLYDFPADLPPGVTTLDMAANKLHSLTATGLARLRSLVNLKLNVNQISVVHDGALQNMVSLQSLNLSGNQLVILGPNSFQGIQALMHLDLSNNSLTNVDGAFAAMTQLSRLDLSHNSLSSITQYTFTDLSDLRYLLLADNRIDDIDRKAFQNLGKLMYLMLKGNPISSVPRFKFNSDYLSYVDLSECGLQQVPRGLPNTIRYLQLRRNNMTVVRRGAFRDCPYVSILVLDENGIEEIEDRTFEHMIYLQQLWINSNRMTRVPKPLPQRLERLLMDSNQVTEIIDVFPSRSRLQKLSFTRNIISRIDHDAFHKLRNLETVDFSDNQIQHVYGQMFTRTPKLETLQLSKNPLRYFHSRSLHGLRTLRTLSLAYVPTTVAVHPDSFQDLTKVIKLDLDASPSLVEVILDTPYLVGPLAAVEDLSIQSSDLTHLSSDFTEYFPVLSNLRLSSARWHCDSTMVWLKHWVMNTNVHLEGRDDLRCFTPRQLHDVPLLSLEDHDFIIATHPPPTQPRTWQLTTFPPTEALPIQGAVEGSGHLGDQENEEDYEVVSQAETSVKTNAKSEDGHFLPDIADFLDFVTPQPHPQDGNNGRHHHGNHNHSRDRASPSPPSNDGYKLETDADTDLSIRIVPNMTSPITVVPPSGENKQDDEQNHNVIIIVIATTFTTLIIAAILIAIIIYVTRKHRRKDNKCYQNGVKYTNRNDVLYFMPGEGEGGSTSDSLKTNASTARDREAMTLVPGRDINHEGPLRVYKWEDF